MAFVDCFLAAHTKLIHFPRAPGSLPYFAPPGLQTCCPKYWCLHFFSLSPLFSFILCFFPFQPKHCINLLREFRIQLESRYYAMCFLFLSKEWKAPWVIPFLFFTARVLAELLSGLLWWKNGVNTQVQI